MWRGHGDSTVCCIGYVEPHVDVKGREDAVDVKGLEDDATERTWRQYRVQARDEVGGRAEHMVTVRRAASATWNSQCEEGAGMG